MEVMNQTAFGKAVFREFLEIHPGLEEELFKFFTQRLDCLNQGLIDEHKYIEELIGCRNVVLVEDKSVSINNHG